ncbi:MAG TPA: OmpH family outer membrane protein [Candidatus Limnocylindrales bacterium]|nr:OmpH family outer membrane protein [Candidatus Limnocylindrales bacterium]
MKIRSILTLASLTILSAAPAVMAQSGGAAQAPATSTGAAPSKIAVLDIQAAIGNSAEGKQSGAELQSSFAPRGADLDAIQKQIADIDKKLQAGANTLSDEEKARMQAQGQLLQNKWKRNSDQINEEANAARAEIMDRIGRKMVDVVDRYARENGIGVVIDSSGQANPVLYRATQLDITADIVKLYDQQYPVKAAAAAAPKTTPPATNPPAKKPGGQQ